MEGTREVGELCYKVSDVALIDGVCVNGSGRLIRWLAITSRKLQTGFIYHYALSMVLGVLFFISCIYIFSNHPLPFSSLRSSVAISPVTTSGAIS